MRSGVARLFQILVAAALFLVAGTTHAQESRRAGTIRLEAMSGSKTTRGPLDLRFTQDGFSGELVIVNDGKEPLVVSRIAVRGDASDPRAPPKLVARTADGVPATKNSAAATRI